MALQQTSSGALASRVPRVIADFTRPTRSTGTSKDKSTDNEIIRRSKRSRHNRHGSIHLLCGAERERSVRLRRESAALSRLWIVPPSRVSRRNDNLSRLFGMEFGVEENAFVFQRRQGWGYTTGHLKPANVPRIRVEPCSFKWSSPAVFVKLFIFMAMAWRLFRFQMNATQVVSANNEIEPLGKSKNDASR